MILDREDKNLLLPGHMFVSPSLNTVCTQVVTYDDRARAPVASAHHEARELPINATPRFALGSPILQAILFPNSDAWPTR